MSTPLAVGQIRGFRGNVTTLQWIKPGAERMTERSLGYHTGRLAKGYWVLLLKQALSPADFQFFGTTLRSGGRAGLPAATEAEDQARRSVHESILAERGAGGYAALQMHVLRNIGITGPQRIAKVLPTLQHVDTMAPCDQYPMGGGGLQWNIVRNCSFLVAVQVTEDGKAITPGFTVNLTTGGLDARTKLRRYMEGA
ncbi:hypothetical protein [Rhodospira trueperi]|uniref:Uncharacterized protein n=1 Tax=Rhodospira trueperi TaxID=69960 RepID=A0A1G7BWA0_9PROT|nr:hypothetical protein [Rhodospira trueperi]SDE31391.1 hypothetical protein SAMN05421720_105203 [Rhodospira trueperi]